MRKAMAAIDSAVATVSDFAFGADAAHNGAHAHGQRAFDQHIVTWAESGFQEVDDFVQAVRLQHLVRSEPGPARLSCCRLRAWAVRDQQVEHRRGANAYPLMARSFFAAQLEHIAEHADLPPTW